MDEINDTETDRSAVSMLKAYFLDLDNFDPRQSSVRGLNEAWSFMARRMAGMTESQFQGVVKGVTLEREKRLQRQAEAAGKYPQSHVRGLASVDRALELLDLIVDWRWQTAAAEAVDRGDDPYALPPKEQAWRPPEGWVRPKGQP